MVCCSRQGQPQRLVEARSPLRVGVTGVVVDERDAPLEGVLVCAHPRTPCESVLPTVECSQSGADGRFAIGSNSECDRVLTAGAPHHEQAQTVVWLPEDPEPWVRMERRRSTFRGVVLDGSNRPIPGALVWDVGLRRDRMKAYPDTVDVDEVPKRILGNVAVAGPDGGFEKPLFNETIWIEAAAPGYFGHVTRFEPLPDPEGFRVMLFSEGTISGTVHSKVGLPPASLRVAARGEGECPCAEVDAEGRFTLRGLAPGAYRPQVTGGGYAGTTTRSLVLLGGDEITGVSLALQAVPTLEAQVTVRGSTVACGDGEVSLTDRFRHRSSVRRLGRTGAVYFPALEASSYRATIRCTGHPAGKVVPFTVGTSTGALKMQWTVEPGASIGGRSCPRESQLRASACV